MRYPTAAYRNECLFRRPVALTLRMSMNIDIDIGGERGSPTLTTSMMSVYLTDTGMGVRQYARYVNMIIASGMRRV